MKKDNKVKNILNVVTKALTLILIAFTVFMMVFTIVSVTTLDKNDRSIFGFKFYIVQTDSMSESDKNQDIDVHFNAGDIILIKNVKSFSSLKAGDIIAFLSTNSVSYGETVTHMIREVQYDSNGRLIGYVTYGTNTGTNDEAIVEPEYVLGTYAGKLPGVGNFFAFVKTTQGYILCILIPFLLLILYNGVNVIRLFRRYKKEQTAAMDAERAKIAEERKQNEEMLRELQALKEQLEKQSNNKSDK
jgi:signal peptidase I